MWQANPNGMISNLRASAQRLRQLSVELTQDYIRQRTSY